MDRGATSSRTKVMNKGSLPITPRGSSELAQSLKADLLTSLDAISRGSEGGLEVPCPIAPPMISPPATPNHDLPQACQGGMSQMPAPPIAEHNVHGANAAWWDTPVAPPVAPSKQSWCGPPDCLELLQRPAHQDCVGLLQRPTQDCVELLQRPAPTDCVEVFKAHKQGRQIPIPRQIPPRQLQALSAHAPEFVPEGSSVMVPASSLPVQHFIQHSTHSGLPEGEAPDYQPEEVAYMTSSATPQKSADPDSMCCPTASISPMCYPTESRTASCDESGGDAEQQKPAITVEELPADIPSIGSLGHETGDCRRCNFFHKGRCQNGRSCVFCHFPHEKRKTSRKEGQQVHSTDECAGIQIERGAPGLELQDQLTPRALPVTMGPRPVKVSTGTQTEDDLPPCLLCCEPPSAQEMTPPNIMVLKKGMKEEKGKKEEHSSHQGKMHTARIGGC